MSGLGGIAEGAINGFAGAPSLPASVTMPGIFVGGAPLDKAASASYSKWVDGTATASSACFARTRFSRSSSRGSATSSSKTTFVIVPSLIKLEIVSDGSPTTTCNREPYLVLSVASKSSRLSNKKRQRFGPTFAGVAQAGSRQYKGRTALSAHASVSAALSCTLRFLRNHTAVVMALAEAKDARRRRSGGVVLSVQPELADSAACRLLSLQIARRTHFA